MAEPAEKGAVDTYLAALAIPNLPADLRALLQLQYRRIAEVHERLEALRESTTVS